MEPRIDRLSEWRPIVMEVLKLLFGCGLRVALAIGALWIWVWDQ